MTAKKPSTKAQSPRRGSSAAVTQKPATTDDGLELLRDGVERAKRGLRGETTDLRRKP
jgi:hypothetical protein